MSTDPQPTTPPDDDFTVIENLAANALPITGLLVAMIEYTEPMRLKRMRLRDSWLSIGPSGPQVNFALAIGGALRGGENGAYWGRLRLHPLYLSDADLVLGQDMEMLTNWAAVSFLVPGSCAPIVSYLVSTVPHMTETPVEKYVKAQRIVQGRSVVGIESNAPAIAEEGAAKPKVIDQINTRRALIWLAGRVEGLKAPARET